MTGFPIVIGTGPRHSSSRPFPRQRGDNNGDNSSSKSSNPNNVIIATGTNDDETLTATVFISYQFLPISIGSGGGSSNNNTEDATNNDNDESQHKEQNSNSQEIRKNEVNDDPPSVAVLVPTRFNVIAELRVQISPSTSPFVSNVDAHMSSRETKCRVPLGIMVRQQQTIQTPEQVQQQQKLLSNIDNDDDDPLLNTTTKTLSPNASVIFSSNESHLACLIPFPRRYELVNTTTMTTTTTTTTPSVVSSSVSPQLPPATSTLVVFRIQKQSFTMKQQQRQQKRVLPPLPDYIVEKTSGSNGKGGVTNNYDYAHVVDDNDFTDTTTITMAQEFGVMGITVNDGGGGGEKNTHDNGSTTRKANEMGNINGSRLDSTNQPPTTTREEPPASFSSSRGNDFMSYVAHEPKIVRVAPRSQELSDDEFLENTNSLPKNNESSTHKKNRLFQRKPSSGNSATANASSSSPLQCATCICNVPFDHNRGRTGMSCSSMLMVGSVDGSLVIVNYLSARVHCMLLNNGSDIIPNSNVENSMENPSPGNIRQACNPIVHLAQCPPTQWKPHNIYGEEQGSDSRGRISIIRRDGSAAIYATSFRPPLSFDAPQPSTSSSHHSLNVNGSTSFGSHGVSLNAMLIGEKEMNNVKAAGGKGVGLELQIELLAIFRSLNTTEISSPSLRYIRSMWLNPLILVLLTRSPNLDEISLTNTQKNTMAMPVEMTVAQVWTVAEILHDNSLEEVNIPAKNSDMWLNASCPASADISLVSELKLPCGNGDRMEELAHGSFSISQGNVSKPQYDKSDNFIDTDSHEKQRIEDDANVSFFAQCENSTYISYHRGTDCLAISSNVLIRTTSCGATAEVMPTR